MKQAVLHTGQVLHFPDETPDEHIHAQVRAHLGLPPPEPPPDPVLLAHQQTQAAVQGAQASSDRLAQSTTALYQQIGALVQSLQAAFAQLAHSVTAVNDAAAQAITHLSGVANAMHESAQHTHAAAGETRDAIQDMGNRLEKAHTEHGAALDRLAKTISAPKRAVKDKDGNWRTENVES